MNICVIGLGSMGRRRIRLLKKIAPDAAIVGIDTNLERAEKVSREYKIECYASFERMDIQCDCAFVCTSPRSHASIIKNCLENNFHVFSEINLIDDLYTENIQLAEKRKKVLFLSSTPMYKEEMQFIEKKVKQNGRPCVYQYHIGQYLPDWHPWDNLKEFFVSDKQTNGCREFLAIELPWIQRTFGKIVNVSVIKRTLTELGLNFPDTYSIQMEHENGSIGNLLVDVVSRQAVRCFEVLNENLYIRWNGAPQSLYEKDLLSGELRSIECGTFLHEDGYADFINETAYIKEIEDFFNAINGGNPLYSFEEDRAILRIIDKIER